MRAIFLADAHLHHPGDANYRLLLEFIRSLQGTTTTLCILGDLFDFRVGLPALAFPEQEPLLKALEELHAFGTRLIYLEGNHDFHLGADLGSRLEAEVHPGPVQLELQGKQVFLCHGDLINRADWRYRLLHRTLRNPLTLRFGRLLPAAVVQGLRSRLQHTSKQRYSRDRKRWDYSVMIRSYAASIRAQGAQALVLGHFHQPFIDQQDDFTLVSLGDWISHYSYAELVDGSFRLLTYPA
ncbi:UDP-2,3-diacylglucosamine diphosphatase [Trichlorobacter lovleyi]|uniref:Metallophosphoesterase n=1 Tax=Trichlorobacter lovleyi (strain ATCC BAA-1151 / DSM 17278 / SZ) TaxID=398767 RepID=B3E8F1_TRIL1|nr:UDP-2,3-diacylglucosamine diphosphatase [Trichlorobacter lovleyi]ACD96627.1 metallophosphoesterase [Trichlorobacter lovleyi SZ]